jgi:hypothetical protein
MVRPVIKEKYRAFPKEIFSTNVMAAAPSTSQRDINMTILRTRHMIRIDPQKKGSEKGITKELAQDDSSGTLNEE